MMKIVLQIGGVSIPAELEGEKVIIRADDLPKSARIFGWSDPTVGLVAEITTGYEELVEI